MVWNPWGVFARSFRKRRNILEAPPTVKVFFAEGQNAFAQLDDGFRIQTRLFEPGLLTLQKIVEAFHFEGVQSLDGHRLSSSRHRLGEKGIQRAFLFFSQ